MQKGVVGMAALIALCLTGCMPAAVEQTPEPEPVVEEVPEPVYLPHAAYMRGNDCFFWPDQALSRAETATLLNRLFGQEPEELPEEPMPEETAPETAPEAVTEEQPEPLFSDVPEGAWYTADVEAMAEVLPGHPDGTYKPMEQVTMTELSSALALLSGQELTPEEGADPEAPVTRASAAVLLNRVLGRTPDREALDSLQTQPFLDVPKTHPAYYDILEASLTHEVLEETGECWNQETIQGAQMDEGIHSSHVGTYYVDAKGAVVTTPGRLQVKNKTYLILEDGQAARQGLHTVEERLVYVTEDGWLLKNEAWNGYSFDADGWYHSGDETLDGFVTAALEACTTAEMTREEKLRAAYEYVRGLRYLGRNGALPKTCKTIPWENAVTYANKIFETGKGDCYNFASAFCFLARALGYKAEAIAGSCGYVWNSYAITHGWVEITMDGAVYLFDPQIENYNIRYGISNESRGAYQVTYETAPGRYYKS